MIIFYLRNEELGHRVELTSDFVNSNVDLKFFPEAPAEKEMVDRVREIDPCCSYTLNKPFPKRCSSCVESQ